VKIGANGAGKTTLGRVLSGLIPAASGSIHFDGADVTALPAQEVRRLGLVYLPEGRRVFPSLSVADNLKLAVRTLPKHEREAAVSAAMAMFPVFGQRRKQLAGQLSGGVRSGSARLALRASPGEFGDQARDRGQGTQK
jgi:ABC-type branched-subunit amino acid transport system ATPase component